MNSYLTFTENTKMTKKEMGALQPGDIVQGKLNGLAFTIVEKVGDVLVAIRTVQVSNPDEWTLVKKADGN